MVASLSDSIVFAAFERGHDDIEAYVQPINSWPEFLSFVTDMAASEKFKMMAIDTINAAWTMYRRSYLDGKGATFEGDVAHGRAWTEMKHGFSDAFFQLQKHGKGLIFIAHQTEEPLGDSGKIIIRPNYPKDKENLIKGTISSMVDCIWWMGSKMIPDPASGLVNNTRIIRCAGDEMYECGGRFPMPDEVELINGDPAKSAKKLLAEYMKFNKEEVKA